MLGVMASMGQKDSYTASYRPRSSPTLVRARARPALLVLCSSHCAPSSCCQAQDARYHGRYGPEGQLRGEIHVDKPVDVPVVRVVQVSQVQVLEEVFKIPQLQLVEKLVVIPDVDGPVPQTSESLGSSWTRLLTCPLVSNFLVLQQKTAVSLQLQLIDKVLAVAWRRDW